MSHLDEGTLHALLDGELDTTETRQIEAHLDRCTDCGTRLEEIKQVRTEADHLIASLETTPAAPREAPAAPPTAPATASAAREAPTVPLPARKPADDAWSGPILLIPDLPPDVVLEQQRRRRTRWRWAAIAVLAIGLTYGGLQFSRSARSVPTALSDAGQPAAEPVAPVLSPQEAVVPPASAPSPSESLRANATDSLPTRTADDGRPSDLATAAKAARPADTPALAERQRGEIASAAQGQQKQQRQQAAPAAAKPSPNVPVQSSPEPAPTPPTPAPVVVAPPAPPSLEERSQVYLRIGLDEAQRQLGGPLHVIEGMSPALVGLVQGKDSPGMDDSRPVVRAVYLDPTNRLIFLDQQRMRAGQSPGAASPLRVVLGDVLVYLRGEPNPNVLRNLVPRIR